jgi:hypothetical protein
MPRPISPKPFSNVSYLFHTLVHCPSRAALQPMHIKEIRPARYYGKDTVFCRCTECGNETTERVATREGPSKGSEIQWQSPE